MIKTEFGSIVSHKFNNEYICYDSRIQPILMNRILDSFRSDEFRLSNTSNILDLNNGFVKKHFWRKGAMSLFNDNYLFHDLRYTRPVRELKNYIDFSSIVRKYQGSSLASKIELCTPIFAYVKRSIISYQGDIILTKINGRTLEATLKTRNIDYEFEKELAFCFKFMFSSGIYNIDMNLTNIMFNEDTKKFSFIDFDKIIIDQSLANNLKYTTRVLNRFKKSLDRFELTQNFKLDVFISNL